ncbi:MAG: hypothetical protein KDD56_06930, partial [Bdellovibrionales bacterium]|nr:hypothetical protein [Bdellovibrionales bacterium]
FDSNSSLAEWIDGKNLHYTYEKGVFQLYVPRENPSFETIQKYPRDPSLAKEVRAACDHLLSTIHCVEDSTRDFSFSKRQIELIRQDFLRLRWEDKILNSSKDVEAVENLLMLCDTMLGMDSLRRIVRKQGLIYEFDVPKAAGIYDRTERQHAANKIKPISSLEAETGLAHLRMVFGTKDHPKQVGAYMTYLVFVPKRGPRVVCKSIKKRVNFPRREPHFAINIGQPASGLKKWLRHADLAYNALRQDDFYKKRRSIFVREFIDLVKLLSPKTAYKKLFGIKDDRVKGVVGNSGVITNVLEAFRKKPIACMFLAPGVLLGTTARLISHHLPLYILQLTDRTLGVALAPWARAEMNPTAKIFEVLSNGDNGMGLMEVNNIDFREVENLGNEAFIKTEMKNSRFINCGLSGTNWKWSQLHNVSFKMYSGVTGWVERIPFLNKILWPPGKPDFRVRARSMDMTGIRVTGWLSFAGRADFRGTKFNRAFRVGFIMRGAWLNEIETDDMTRWAFMFPPGYEFIRRIPILGSMVILPIYRRVSFAYYCEGCHRGTGERWKGLGDPEKVLAKMFFGTEWGPQWSMEEYEDFVKYLKKSAAFKRSTRTRIPTFLQQYVAGVDDYVVVDFEGCDLKFLVTWDGGADNRVLGFLDHPQFFEEASKRVKAPRYLAKELQVARDKWSVPQLEKLFANIATVNREVPTGDMNDLPDLVRELYTKLGNLDEKTRYRMEKAEEAAALRGGGGVSLSNAA